MTTNQPRPTVRMIHDREGDGHCGICQREGLRWVVELSDGSMVGLECAKRVMGYRPAPKAYSWLNNYTLVGSLNRTHETFGWYVSKDGRAGAITINGVLTLSGPVEWAKKEFARYAA